MEKITEYKIVLAKSPAEMSQTLNEMIEAGWIPTGGVFITQSPNKQQVGDYTVVENYFHQAMVKLKVF